MFSGNSMRPYISYDSLRLKTGDRVVLGLMDPENLREAEKLDDFVNAFGHVEQPEIAVVLARLFGKADECAKPRAADIIKIATIQNQGIPALLKKDIELGLQPRERIHVQRSDQADELYGAARFLIDPKILHGCCDLLVVSGTSPLEVMTCSLRISVGLFFLLAVRVTPLDGFAQEPGQLFEPRCVALVDTNEIVLCLDHQVGGLVLVQWMLELGDVGVRQLVVFGVRRGHGCIGIDEEEPIQPKRLKQVHVASIDVDDVDGGCRAVLPQPQSNPRQHTEKGAVHTLTGAEIDNEFFLSLVDFLQGELA